MSDRLHNHSLLEWLNEGEDRPMTPQEKVRLLVLYLLVVGIVIGVVVYAFNGMIS